MTDKIYFCYECLDAWIGEQEHEHKAVEVGWAETVDGKPLEVATVD